MIAIASCTGTWSFGFCLLSLLNFLLHHVFNGKWAQKHSYWNSVTDVALWVKIDVVIVAQTGIQALLLNVEFLPVFIKFLNSDSINE